MTDMQRVIYYHLGVKSDPNPCVGPGKLPECILCESKHVLGLIAGSIPGRGPSNITGFSPGTSSV